MEKLFKYLSLGLCITLLAGCFIPEKFDASMQFNSDSSFNYTYDGTVVNALGLVEKRKNGSLSEKSKAEFPKIIAQMKKDPATKSVSQVDDVTYKISLEKKNQASNLFSLMDFIKVRKDQSGVITVFTPKFSDKNLKELKELGVTVDGTLKITLPKNAEVIESNAQSSPSLGGMVGSYTWKFKKVDEPVNFKFKMK